MVIVLKIKAFIFPILTVLFLLGGLFFLQQGTQAPGVRATVEENVSVAVHQMEERVETSMPEIAEGDFSVTGQSDFELYLYENLDLIGWSEKSFVPTSSQVDESFTLKLLQVGQGDFIVRKWDINPTKFLIGVLTLRRKDGSRFSAALSSAIFIDSNGAQRTSMFVRDLTEQEQREEALRVANAKLSRAIEEVHRLQGILPICSYCKRIRLQ